MKGEPMDRDEFMELVYETFADEPDNVLANGIIEAADAYVEHEKEQLFSEGTTSDLISRQAVINAIENTNAKMSMPEWDEITNAVMSLPPAQPEPTGINAKEAVYNLAEKIGIHQLFALTVELRGEPIQPEPQWILITERLPRDGSWNIFTDGKNISVERYKADAIDHFFPPGRWFQLEDVIAWMPLPTPYTK